MQALYWRYSQPWDALPEVIRELGAQEHLPPHGQRYALELCRAVEEGRSRYERALAEASQHWDADRIGRVERIIILLALAEWELKPEDAPPKVVLDEAVTLAREFCGADAARFVNGVLDRIGHEWGLL